MASRSTLTGSAPCSQIRSQQIHVFQIQRSGQLLPVHVIGPQQCQGDDDLTLRMAEAAEERWQQDAQQDALRESAVAGPPGRARLWFSAAERAAADLDAPKEGGAEVAGPSGGDHTLPLRQPSRLVQQRVGPLGGLQPNGGIRPHRHRGGAVPAPGPQLAGGPPGDAGMEGPPPPLLGGLRQRMLAHIFLTRLRRGGSSARRQQAELRWFYRSFDLYCSLVAWRVWGWRGAGGREGGREGRRDKGQEWGMEDSGRPVCLASRWWLGAGRRAGTRPHQVEDPHHVIM